MSKLKIEILAGDEVVASWEGGEEALRLRLSVDNVPSADITINSPKLIRPIGDDFTLPLPDGNGSWDEDKRLYRKGKNKMIGFFVADNEYVYALRKPHEKKEGGLALYELSNILNNDLSDHTDTSYMLTKSAISLQGEIDY